MSQELMNRKLHKNEADKLAPEMTMGTESMNQACPRKGKYSEGKHCLWTKNRFDYKPTEKISRTILYPQTRPVRFGMNCPSQEHSGCHLIQPFLVQIH